MPLRDCKNINKTELYKIAIYISNFITVFGAILTAVYLVIPLFGAEISFAAIIAYASWIGIGLGVRPLLNKKIKGLKPGIYDYIVACLFVIFSIIVWWKYPFNVIFSILVVLGFMYSYKDQRSL